MPAAATKPDPATAGGATALSAPEPAGKDAGRATTVAASAPAKELQPATSSGSGVPLIGVVVIALALAYLGGRLGYHLWRRRTKRQYREVFRRQDEDWEDALHQIQISKTAPAAGASGKQLQRS